MMNKYYTGIGSRETPTDILEIMSRIARNLDIHGYTVRSGGAGGADSAFDLKTNAAEIFLPWNSFNGHYTDNKRYFVPELDLASKFVEKYHPAPKKLSAAGYKLMARNSFQVLGQDLKTPSRFIICWTPDGKMVGGTSQALRIAIDNKIKIYNLADYNARESILKLLGDHNETN